MPNTTSDTVQIKVASPDGTAREITVRPSVNDIGEGYVLNVLMQDLGFEAELTPAGTRAIDIRVTAPVAIDVQVKTATGPRWQVSGERGVRVSPSVWYVLVQWNRDTRTVVRSLVLSSAMAHEIATEQHQEWRARTAPESKERGRYIVERVWADSQSYGLSRFETWEPLLALKRGFG